MGSKGRGRRVVIAYSLVAAATQVLWLTYAPIDTSAAHHYGVSTGAIGWLAEIFPLLYVVLALPAGRLLDAGFRPALAGGAALVALGGLLRLGGQTFAWAMAGQVAVAIAQPLVLNAVGKLAADYLPVEDRAAGIAVGAGAGFAGMLLALLLGPTLGGHGHIERLLVVEAVLALAAAVVLAWELRAPAPNEGTAEEERAAVEGRVVRQLWSLPQMRTMAGLVFVGFGVFVAITTWLQTLLEPAGVSEQGTGALLVGMLVAGMIGCAVLPPLVDRRGAERTFMRAAAATAIVGPVLLGLATPVAARAVVLAAMGFVLLPALPIILTAAERLAGSAMAGTAGAIVWLAGNLGGLVVALVVQALVHHPTPALLAMAVLSLPAALFAERFVPSALPRLSGT
ncbi:MAG TPA: MFS transporter [Solirubrobacterales bacterium]|nr:MFS transporter [Solirubrobacterales bacterium]